MTPRSVAEILSDAADYIAEHGWWQDDFWTDARYRSFRADRDGTPPCCAAGAINMSLLGDPEGDDELVDPVKVALCDYLGLVLDDTLGPNTAIGEWNDHPARTAREVIDALRGAAAAQLPCEAAS